MSRLESLWLRTHDAAMTAAHGRDLPVEDAPRDETPVTWTPQRLVIGDGYDSRRRQTLPPTAKAAYQREYRRRQALKRGAH
jgi:hypothetical protein